MAPHDLRRPFKRRPISDQQRRRELSLLRQSQHRSDAQQRARNLASSVISLQSSSSSSPDVDPEVLSEPCPTSTTTGHESEPSSFSIRQASSLRGPEARKWFASQLMLPEWMIDVPENLSRDWYVLARPAGKRCFVVSADGTTVSRLRNGSVLHLFPSALPGGARKKGVSGPAQSYSILDCIFHEADQTYYVIDMVCWRGYSLYECTAEFRFFWLQSKLDETGACDPPSFYHKFRFSVVPFYNCDQSGLHSAYTGSSPYVKDGLFFYNKHAHYHTGNTPLVLIWKDERCSQYVIDTDNNGQVPNQQHIVLELQDDGKIVTSDDPPVIVNCLNADFIKQSGLSPGSLVRFAIGDGGLNCVDGKFEKADLQYISVSNRARAFADSYSKIMFQYMARHSPVKIEDLASMISHENQQDKSSEVEMSN
ncbi:LOW QUALITY PROTEIN: uncharacterized protein LOC108853383 [Raphanus sativus]|uniref:Snurportin-1 n=1 Tax=Raphanus sativus TaxID=3726 RepID=A0A6J0NDT4_RAPSA|nr:LOW QUALITY PROTEIN: uncharacterized protein LOC108853383 [Raphanus sativus]